MVYELSTVQGRSIAITRHLNQQQVATLRALAAGSDRQCGPCSAIRPKGRRLLRQNSDRTAPADHAAHTVARRRSPSQQRKPRTSSRRLDCDSRTGVISAGAFALAAERLAANKTHAPRRTVTPSVVQGLVSCAKCGYALYRTSTRSSARKIYYYRCLGSHKYRRFAGPVCDNRPVRQDLLDEVVWMEIVRLLEDPQLIQIELDRRLQAAQRADPTKRREDALRRNLLRIRKSIERLLTAYQEGLISLDELRQRMPDLRMREQTDQAELQAIADQSAERTAYLRLAETVTDFLARLRSSAGTLDVSKRQRILRLLVKDILVGDDKIVIRHSIPLPTNPSGGHPPKTDSPGPSPTQSESYLLRSGRSRPALANLYLHYAFDVWMTRRYPDVPWCRYADDGLVHCGTEMKRKPSRWSFRLVLKPAASKCIPTKPSRLLQGRKS